jgi:hypothetical protein
MSVRHTALQAARVRAPAEATAAMSNRFEAVLAIGMHRNKRFLEEAKTPPTEGARAVRHTGQWPTTRDALQKGFRARFETAALIFKGDTRLCVRIPNHLVVVGRDSSRMFKRASESHKMGLTPLPGGTTWGRNADGRLVDRLHTRPSVNPHPIGMYVQDVYNRCVLGKPSGVLTTVYSFGHGNHRNMTLLEYAREQLRRLGAMGDELSYDFVVEPVQYVDHNTGGSHMCLVPIHLVSGDCKDRVQRALHYLEEYTSEEQLLLYHEKRGHQDKQREDEREEQYDNPPFPESADPTGMAPFIKWYKSAFMKYLDVPF